LNLFFNDEVSPRAPLKFERDFFIGSRESSVKVIEIKISFDLSSDKNRDKFLPEKFAISKFYDRNGFRNYIYSFYLKEKEKEIKIDSRSEKNKHIQTLFVTEDSSEEEKKRAGRREWNYRVKFSGFLNKSVSFEYVPAIRDVNFFSQLFGRVITRIKTNEESELLKLEKEVEKIKNWEETVKNKSEKLDFRKNIKIKRWRNDRLKEIESLKIGEGKFASAIQSLESEINEYSARLISSINFLESEFKIGKNLQEFFEGFDVGTGEQKNISLKLRGDGIQSKFVPKILNFLSDIDPSRKYVLWGFEEPENSSEYKNQQELAESFKSDFLKKKQVFITTHSEEFLRLYDGPDIKKSERTANLYHVKKYRDDTFGEYSKIFLFDVDKNEFEFANQKSMLESDLGLSYLRAKYSKDLKVQEDNFLKEKLDLQEENKEFREKIQREQKPLLFVEDTYDQIYKIAWLKLNDKVFSQKNFLSVFDKECPFVIYRTEGANKLDGLLRMSNVGPYKGKAVIGLFDFDVKGVECFKRIKEAGCWHEHTGDKQSGIYRARKDHQQFFSLLLPIPDFLNNLADLGYPSYVEMENLLPESFLLENHFASECFTVGHTRYLGINADKKSDIWKKAILLSKKDYENFRPLFRKIYELFDLD
jgi:hypothetical protein